jgi:hypothetical protein
MFSGRTMDVLAPLQLTSCHSTMTQHVLSLRVFSIQISICAVCAVRRWRSIDDNHVGSCHFEDGGGPHANP